jgi:hypothetical protein
MSAGCRSNHGQRPRTALLADCKSCRHAVAPTPSRTNPESLHGVENPGLLARITLTPRVRPSTPCVEQTAPWTYVQQEAKHAAQRRQTMHGISRPQCCTAPLCITRRARENGVPEHHPPSTAPGPACVITGDKGAVRALGFFNGGRWSCGQMMPRRANPEGHRHADGLPCRWPPVSPVPPAVSVSLDTQADQRWQIAATMPCAACRVAAGVALVHGERRYCWRHTWACAWQLSTCSIPHGTILPCPRLLCCDCFACVCCRAASLSV